MSKEEKQLVLTILMYYLTREEKALLTREQHQMLKQIVEKLSEED